MISAAIIRQRVQASREAKLQKITADIMENINKAIEECDSSTFIKYTNKYLDTYMTQELMKKLTDAGYHTYYHTDNDNMVCITIVWEDDVDIPACYSEVKISAGAQSTYTNAS